MLPDKANDRFTTFGLDRIIEYQIKSQGFQRKKHLHPEDLFDDIIGLDYSYQKKENIILKFLNKQGKYIKTLPLRKSQVILEETENELTIELKLIPNYEFYQKILAKSPHVIVISPEHIKQEMKEILIQSIENYNI